MDAIRKFTGQQYRDALESWHWAGVSGKAPLFASPFGDVFLQDDEGIWFLDRLEGELTRRWATTDELRAELNTESGQDQYLLLGLAQTADHNGLTPGPDEIYEFIQPPKLGGPIEPGNVEVANMVVAINLSGQIHQRVRDLPEGTPIGQITISDI